MASERLGFFLPAESRAIVALDFLVAMASERLEGVQLRRDLAGETNVSRCNGLPAGRGIDTAQIVAPAQFNCVAMASERLGFLLRFCSS